MQKGVSKYNFLFNHKQEIIRDYLAGDPLQSLGKKYKVPPIQISFFIRKNNIERPTKYKPKKEELKQLIQEGKTVSEIADMYQFSKTAIRVWLNKYKIKFKQNNRKGEDKKIVGLYNRGYSTTQIANRINLSRQAISYRLKRNQIKRKRWQKKFFDKKKKHI